MILAEILKQPAKFDCLKNPVILQLESLNFTPFHLIALIIFAIAIVHTLCVYKVHEWARRLEWKQRPKRRGRQRERSFAVYLLYFLSEVEVVFAFWAIFLFIAMVSFYGWTIGLEYINTRDYTEPLFVVVILAMASTKPIVHVAEKMIQWFAKGLGGTLSAWWFVLLTVGPLLGSLITEAAAMALCALLLSRQFYAYHPSQKLAYATLALLFVNISVGGVLTDFASPAVLVLAHFWHWTLTDVFVDFGWKAIVGIVLSNLLYWTYFRKELYELNVRRKAMQIYSHYAARVSEKPIPIWVTAAHMLIMVWIVCVAHYPAIFIASFLFFIAFYQATRSYQYSLRLARPLLIGLFLAGLVIHGGLQGWWVVAILHGLSPLSVMGVAIALTGFNDNTAISYLTTLVPNWGDIYEYAVFTGVVAGGGLTVIANAPNPAGYAILKKHFEKGIRPLHLFLAALIPTCILYAVFYFFGPLF
ncbi:MAG TPA: putative Na+/H+ antiporter [Chlamydiales bacterium]|nr:putative Na+/H+ antiporter [Chlamydiales bacterium]